MAPRARPSLRPGWAAPAGSWPLKAGRAEGGGLPFRSCFRSSSAAVPQQFRSSSEAAPQQLRSSSAAAPQQLRSSSAVVPCVLPPPPQSFRVTSAVVPCSRACNRQQGRGGAFYFYFLKFWSIWLWNKKHTFVCFCQKESGPLTIPRRPRRHTWRARSCSREVDQRRADRATWAGSTFFSGGGKLRDGMRGPDFRFGASMT